MIRRARRLWSLLGCALVLAAATPVESRADAEPPIAPEAAVPSEAGTEDPVGAAGEVEEATSSPPASSAPAALPASTRKAPPLPPITYDPTRKLAWDWVQIDSGEWLKGEILRMHRHKFYFDSDEFGEVSFDWEDVLTLVSKDVVTIRIENQDAVTARIGLRAKVARMYFPDGATRDVPQDKILGMILGAPAERNYWSGGASIGISARAGNTEQADITLRGNLTRQTEWTRWRTNYTGEVSTVNGDETANSHRVPSQLDIYLTRSLFLTTPVFEYFTDKFSNVSSRITFGGGVGYEIFDLSWLYWEVDGSLAYQYTDYSSVEAGDDDIDHDAALILKTYLNFDLRYGIEWDNLYSLQLVVTDLDKTSHHAESSLSFDIWGPLEFDVTFIFDRIESPVPDSSGDRPLSNDYRFTAGLGVDF